MRTGRRRIYDEPVNISLKCERRYHDIITYLQASDTEVYMKGVLALMVENAPKLTPEALELASQELRRELKQEQEFIAMLERIIMDRQIQKDYEIRIKKKTTTIKDERGNLLQAVYSE